VSTDHCLPTDQLEVEQVEQALEAFHQGHPEEFDRLLGESEGGICSLLRQVVQYCRAVPPAGPHNGSTSGRPNSRSAGDTSEQPPTAADT
jgi:hypothetical protein